MRLTPDFDLTASNTMGLPSMADWAFSLSDAEDLPAVVAQSRTDGLPLRILGGGSNVLLPARIEGLVVRMDNRGVEVGDDGEGRVRLTIGAGEVWHDLVQRTVADGLVGLESMAGIPGSMGAAPVQNIGAYGAELSQSLIEVRAYDVVDGVWRVLGAEACRFSYRHSLFKDEPGRFVIASVTLGLKQADDGAARSPAEIMAEVLAQRAAKLPDWRDLGNVGSFFHNPIVTPEAAEGIEGGPRFAQADGRVKLSAGWLIEQCGFKGVRRGPVGVYDRHALVIVNHGGATRADVLGLAAEIAGAVRARFGVELIREPACW